MEIELRKVKVAKFASEETLCYAAEVWIDGARRFHASNDGHGGADLYVPAKGRTSADLGADLADCAAEALRRGVIDRQDDTSEETATEFLIARMLDDREVEAKFNRLLKTRVAFVKDDGLLYSARPSAGVDLGTLAAQVQAKYRTARVLNLMPRLEALALYVEKGVAPR